MEGNRGRQNNRSDTMAHDTVSGLTDDSGTSRALWQLCLVLKEIAQASECGKDEQVKKRSTVPVREQDNKANLKEDSGDDLLNW